MATSSQSLCYGGTVSAGPSGGSSDTLNRILADLCTRGNPKVWVQENFSSFFIYLFFILWIFEKMMNFS